MVDTARFLNRQKINLLGQDENMDVNSKKKQAPVNFRSALGDVGNKLSSVQYISKKDGMLALANKKTHLKSDDTNIDLTSLKKDLENPIFNKKTEQYVFKPEFILLPNTVEGATNSTNKMDISEHDLDEEAEIESDEVEEVHMKSTHVIDIDENDSDNPQLISEYVKDIYNYLNQLERKLRISSNYLDNKMITSKMRAVLVDWLIQVHLKFHLLQETLYLCVQIIDAYLQAEDVSKMQLQLVGVTAMFLASKYEEMYVPTIEDFVYMTDNTYTKAEIRKMEIKILQTLNFMFGKPLPLNFLRRFSKAGQADPKQHTLSKYFMELSLHDSEFSSLDPSYLAACSLCLSFKLLNGPDWNDTLTYYSTYKYEGLIAGMKKISKLVIKSMEPDYKYKAVINKYGSSKFLRISLLPELQGDLIKELACSDF